MLQVMFSKRTALFGKYLINSINYQNFRLIMKIKQEFHLHDW